MIYSICIPTYNRPECVERSLQNLSRISASAHLESDLEVCISDNSEDDRTKKAVEKFAESACIALCYHKQKKNVGFDRNALSAISLATGEYVHLTSDEAVHNPQVLQRTISMLKENKPDCGFLHHRKTILAKSPQGFIDAMFSFAGIKISFGIGMGTFIPKRADALEFASKFSGRMGGFLSHGMMHVPLVLYCLKKSKKVSAVDAISFTWAAGQKPLEREENPRADTPSSIARLYIYHHYAIIGECFKAGIISRQDLENFRQGFLHALPHLLLRIRIFTPPEMCKTEIPRVLENLSIVEKDYGGLMNKLQFYFMRIVILNGFIPYHLVYLSWYFYKRHIKNDREVVNLFQAYRSNRTRPISSAIPEDVYHE